MDERVGLDLYCIQNIILEETSQCLPSPSQAHADFNLGLSADCGYQAWFDPLYRYLQDQQAYFLSFTETWTSMCLGTKE